ncbi:MobA/MobL family protein [Lysobacter capsici]|uniref:MobA/MobL family protein n=1 Tax=Lysobacter capsici TaxID=435897 RepID=UPI0012FDF02F|nr:MobA/MobL family protein [Lysobacter capsici]
MAIYHIRIKVFKRSAGHSVIAAAAYRAGLCLLDRVTGIRHDYTRRKHVVASLNLAPQGAPEWALDPTRVWQEANSAERRVDACLAREFEISLPHELTDAQRLKLVESIANALIEKYGFAIQASIHAPDTPAGLNHHVHILATTRRINEFGFGKKTRELDGGKEGGRQVYWVRAMVAGKINEHLKAAGLSERVDHRKLSAQAMDALQRGDLVEAAKLSRQPTQHLGRAATALHKRGELSKRQRINDGIAEANRARIQALMGRLGDAFPARAPASQVQAVVTGTQVIDPSVAVTQAVLAASLKASKLTVGASTRPAASKTGNKKQDALAAERREREDEIERLLLEAQRIWQEGLNESLRTALAGNMAILFEIKPLIRQYGHLYSFASDVKQFHQAITQAERDRSRFRRRMEAWGRARVKLSHAKADLDEFDTKNPRPGLWSRREWAERRRARATRLAHRQRDCDRAFKATDPDAQRRYKRRSDESLETLRNVGNRFAERYLSGLGSPEPTQSAPVELPAEEVAQPQTSTRRGRGSRRPRVPQPPPRGPRIPR